METDEDVAGCLPCCLPCIVPTGAGVQGAGASSVMRCVFHAFCPLPRFAFGALLANMPLFRVLRAF